MTLALKNSMIAEFNVGMRSRLLFSEDFSLKYIFIILKLMVSSFYIGNIINDPVDKEVVMGLEQYFLLTNQEQLYF